MVDRHEASPGIISELAASIATIDCEVGHGKRAQIYLDKSLLDHTENVEAQARWLLQRYRSDLPVDLGGVLNSPEATAIDLYEKGMLTECRDKLIDVFEFQPFSTGSLVDATFISVALGDNNSVIDLCNDYNFAIEESPAVKNNLAVALLLNNDVEGGRKLLAELENSDYAAESKFTFLATKGLLNYRQGNIEMGAQLYEEAREGFSKTNNIEYVALANAFQASEELRLNTGQGESRFAMAEEGSSKTRIEKEIKNFINILRKTTQLNSVFMGVYLEFNNN